MSNGALESASTPVLRLDKSSDRHTGSKDKKLRMTASSLRLKVATCLAVDALISVLQQMQSLHFVRLRVVAQSVANHDRTNEVLAIELDVS